MTLATARRRDLAAQAACAAVTLLAFLPTLRNGLVATWDDGPYVLENERIRSLSLDLVGWAFSTFYAAFWTPLTWLTLALDRAVFGPEPWGHHLTNALLHAGSAWLLFEVARRLLLRARPDLQPGPARAGAAAAALAWSLHPLRVESVAWVSERKDVLCGVLGLAALLVWLRSVEEAPGSAARRRLGAGALALFALGLCAKGALAALPAVLLILDFFPLRRHRREGLGPILLEKLPWVVLGAAATLLTMRAHAGAAMPFSESSLGSRPLIALRATFDYLRLTLWPSGLSPFYLHPGHVSVADPAYLGPALAVAGLTAAAVLRARRSPAPAAAWFAFLALVAPGLAATQVSLTSMGDRFTYLPGMALAVLAGGGLASLLARDPGRRRWLWAGALAAGVLAACYAVTASLIPVWHDDVSLWSRAIEARPHHSGRVYAQRSLAYEAAGALPEAVADLDEAIAIAEAKGRPGMQDLYGRRAYLELALGRAEPAAEDLGRALALVRGVGRAALLRRRAEAWRALGRWDLAEQDLRDAELP